MKWYQPVLLSCMLLSSCGRPLSYAPQEVTVVSAVRDGNHLVFMLNVLPAAAHWPSGLGVTYNADSSHVQLKVLRTWAKGPRQDGDISLRDTTVLQGAGGGDSVQCYYARIPMHVKERPGWVETCYTLE